MDIKIKTGRYNRLYDQIKSLMPKCDDYEARLATIAAVLHHKMEYFFWTGFYFLKNGRLIVKIYQGPVACMELKKDTGVCWACINQQKTIIVSDVHQFPGHIACDSRSKSEICIPVFDHNNQIIAVFDIDSDKTDMFDQTDAMWLEKILQLARL